MSADLTIPELALKWRCSRGAIADLIRSGELPAAKIAGRWLITEADADAYKKARMNVAPVKPTIRRRRSA